MREIWVPSTFDAEVFGRSGIAPARLRVVPIGVDTGVFRPPAVVPGAAGRPVRMGGFKFLSVLTWQWRKGWDLLLEAYLSEFEPDERVRLVLKTPLPRRHPERAMAALGEFIENRLGRNPERIPPVFLIQGPMTDRELASLYAACDAFVLPSRGEGWGRPYLEAMATGLPAIGTGWGGNLDFMDEANSYLIAVEELERVGQHATRVISASANWARPSVGHLRQLMRHVFSRPPEAQARAARARRDAVSRWDLAVTGRLLVAEVERGAGHLMMSPGALPRRVLLVCSSWGRACGIASYTERLRAGLAATGVEADVARNAAEVRRRLAGRTGYLGVVLQFEYGLYRNDLADLAEALEESGLPLAVTLHSVNSRDGHMKANRLLLELPATFVAHSDEALQELRRAGRRLRRPSPDRAAVVPMGCPDLVPEPVEGQGSVPATRREMGLGEAQFVVGFFGFAAEHKGVPNLVRALATLPNVQGYIAATAHPRNPRAVGIIYEQCGLARGAAAPAASPPARAALGNVIIVHERIPDEDFLRYQNAVDVIALPYAPRGATLSSSMMVCEALASRRPVLATDVTYFSGLGDCIYRIPDNEPETIATAITALRRNATLREALVERASRYAREHSWPKMAQRYLKLLGRA